MYIKIQKLSLQSVYSLFPPAIIIPSENDAMVNCAMAQSYHYTENKNVL